MVRLVRSLQFASALLSFSGRRKIPKMNSKEINKAKSHGKYIDIEHSLQSKDKENLKNNNYEQVKSLILCDGVSNYTLYVSPEVHQHAVSDLSFATTLLNQHKATLMKQASCALSTNETNGLQENFTFTDKENYTLDGNLYNSRIHWTSEQTRLLLHLYEKHCTALDNSEISNRTFWKYLNEGLKKKGYNFSMEQCKSKINNMKKIYKEVKDHNAQSGNNRKICEHYDIMDNLFSKKPWIKPLSSAGSDIPIGSQLEEEIPSKRRKVSDNRNLSSNWKLEFIEEYKRHKQMQREATDEYRNTKLSILKEIAKSMK